MKIKMPKSATIKPYLNPASAQKGIALLLVIVILSAVLSISIGVFNVIYGQIQISGELADSFVAFYAADQGIEKMLYRNRVLNEICTVPGNPCYTEGLPDPIIISSGGCYAVRISYVGGITTLVTTGQYRCGTNPPRVVKRGYQLTY